MGAPVHIVLILIVSLVARALIHGAIDRFVSRVSATAVTHDRPAEHVASAPARSMASLPDLVIPAERRRQRTQAVGALLKSITTAIIFSIAFITVLGELGVNLAPIVASAGIAGIALGFGAQSLVRDFLNGVFMILEDQYGVGDVIDSGFATGTVEDVGLRITQIRDVNGVVWYVRNGEVLRIGNRSQGWATATVDFPLAYDEDLVRVRRLIDEVGEAMATDADWKDKLLDSPQLVGVEAITGAVVTIRITARTAPQQQLPVSRELRERIKGVFDREGVVVPIVRPETPRA